MSQHPDHMQARMPGALPEPPQATSLSAPKPGFRIVIPAEDGTILAEMFETGEGKLDIRYDPERTTEAAMRFLDSMRQWSGQVGIRWQDEVEKAAGG